MEPPLNPRGIQYVAGVEKCYTLTELDQAAEYLDYDWLNKLPARIFVVFVYTAIGLLGLICNLALIISILSKRLRMTVGCILILSVCFSDVFLCITSIPFTPWYSMSNWWPFNITLTCHTLPLCQGVCVTVTSSSLCALAMQKYYRFLRPALVCSPRTDGGNNRSSSVLMLSLVVAIWIIGIIMQLPLSIVAVYSNTLQGASLCRFYCLEDWTHLGGERGQKVYGASLFLLQLIIPSTLVYFCYSRMLWLISQDVDATNLLPHSAPARRSSRSKRRSCCLLLIMYALFSTLWTIVTIPTTLTQMGFDVEWWNGGYHWSYFVRLLLHAVSYSTVIWNPLMYFWISATQRKTISNMIRTLSLKLSSDTLSRKEDERLRAKFFQNQSNQTLATPCNIIEKKYRFSRSRQGSTEQGHVRPRLKTLSDSDRANHHHRRTSGKTLKVPSSRTNIHQTASDSALQDRQGQTKPQQAAVHNHTAPGLDKQNHSQKMRHRHPDKTTPIRQTSDSRKRRPSDSHRRTTTPETLDKTNHIEIIAEETSNRQPPETLSADDARVKGHKQTESDKRRHKQPSPDRIELDQKPLKLVNGCPSPSRKLLDHTHQRHMYVSFDEPDPPMLQVLLHKHLWAELGEKAQGIPKGPLAIQKSSMKRKLEKQTTVDCNTFT